MRVPGELRGQYRNFFVEPFRVWQAAISRWEERQLITTAVSQANLAAFCVAWHRERAVEQLSEKQVAQALDARAEEALAPGRLALLEFAEQLTISPENMTPEAVGRAIDAGASVDRLRVVVEIAATTAVMNRITTTIDVTPRDMGRRSRRPS